VELTTNTILKCFCGMHNKRLDEGNYNTVTTGRNIFDYNVVSGSGVVAVISSNVVAAA
jgi:hypothetical protein